MTTLQRSGVLASLLLLAGCGAGLFLGERDSEIQAATHALETARTDAERAKAHSSRGVAYSEKARYSRVMNRMLPTADYESWFNQAIADHDQAIALDPSNAEFYFNRAQAYYDRGSLDVARSTMEPGPHAGGNNRWLAAAAADFEKAVEREPKNAQAWDRLGLAYEENEQDDQAIRAYTSEMALDRLGKSRLADAYCGVGFRHHQKKEYVEAAAAFRKSIDFGVADDKSCPYDPFQMSAWIYTTQTHEYDKAWDVVQLALKAGKAIAPETLAELVKESGRKN